MEANRADAGERAVSCTRRAAVPEQTGVGREKSEQPGEAAGREAERACLGARCCYLENAG